VTSRVVSAVTCLGCGCACDDIEVVVEGNRIAEARNACPLGAAWFGDGVVPGRVHVGGREASLDEALDAVSRLLAGATRPLIYLAPDLSCEAQGEAVALADVSRAFIDSVTSATAMRSILAAQETGRATATLGEVRHRADVVVFWGVDPAERYPRFSTRYAPGPAGLHVPGGRRSRLVIAVDVGGSRGPVDADRRVAVTDEVAFLTLLAAGVRRRHPESDPGIDRRRVAETAPGSDLPSESVVGSDDGMERLDVAATGRLLLAGRYVAIVADGEPQPGRDPGRADALVALAQALNAQTRAALVTLRAGGNRSGADACMTWQSGYPAAVDFARGAPAYRPHDDAAARLARNDVDAALIVGAVHALPDGLRAAMAGVPCAVIGPRASEAALPRVDAAIDTGVAGIHDGGTALRLDDVPLPLRTTVTGARETAATVRALRARFGERAA
jgi:formylmethanofuran dehydrogenase subunit B